MALTSWISTLRLRALTSHFQSFWSIVQRGYLKRILKYSSIGQRDIMKELFLFMSWQILLKGTIFSCLKCIKTIHAKSIQFFKKDCAVCDNLLIDDGWWWDNLWSVMVGEYQLLVFVDILHEIYAFFISDWWHKP